MELNLDQIKELEDLLTTPAWPLYQRLLKEKFEISLEDMRNAKDWSDFIESRAMANLLELDIIPLIPTTLEQWREEHRSIPDEIDEEV